MATFPNKGGRHGAGASLSSPSSPFSCPKLSSASIKITIEPCHQAIRINLQCRLPPGSALRQTAPPSRQSAARSLRINARSRVSDSAPASAASSSDVNPPRLVILALSSQPTRFGVSHGQVHRPVGRRPSKRLDSRNRAISRRPIAFPELSCGSDSCCHHRYRGGQRSHRTDDDRTDSQTKSQLSIHETRT